MCYIQFNSHTTCMYSCRRRMTADRRGESQRMTADRRVVSDGWRPADETATDKSSHGAILTTWRATKQRAGSIRVSPSHVAPSMYIITLSLISHVFLQSRFEYCNKSRHDTCAGHVCRMHAVCKVRQGLLARCQQSAQLYRKTGEAATSWRRPR